MPDPTTFETRLADAFARYVATAPTEVDAAALARSVVGPAVSGGTGPGTTRWLLRWLPSARPLRFVVIAVLLVALAATMVIVGSFLLREAAPPRLSTLPDMAIPRNDPIVISLADGRVLIAGGQISTDSNGQPIEILDPETGAMVRIDVGTPTGSGVGAQLHDGRVFLIAHDSNQTCSRAAVIDPAAGTSRVLELPGFCNAPPFGIHGSLVALADGRVLVSGGKVDVYEREISRAAVIFDPATETFTATGPMTSRRIGHGLALLRDGRVLVAGGYLTDSWVEDPVGDVAWNALPTLELFDPVAGTFTDTGTMQQLRGPTTAVTLMDGRVALFADQRRGVRDAQAQIQVGPSAGAGPFPVEVFDPATGATSIVGALASPASGALLVDGGRVFVHGWVVDPFTFPGSGLYYDRATAWAVVFDPESGTVIDLPEPRTVLAGAAALPDGRVILAGGWAFPPADAIGNGTAEGAVVPFIDLYEIGTEGY